MHRLRRGLICGALAAGPGFALAYVLEWAHQLFLVWNADRMGGIILICVPAWHGAAPWALYGGILGLVAGLFLGLRTWTRIWTLLFDGGRALARLRAWVHHTAAILWGAGLGAAIHAFSLGDVPLALLLVSVPPVVTYVAAWTAIRRPA